MNKAHSTRKRGFFDMYENPDPKFWNEAKPDQFSKLTKNLDENFYTKDNKNLSQWQNCSLLTYGTYLALKRVIFVIRDCFKDK